MTDPTDPTVIDAASLAPPRGQIDETCAGIPLDMWRHGEPLESVMAAVRSAAEHPDTQVMAYCHEKSPKEFGLFDDRQKKAGKAWATREYPHLAMRLRTETLPYRGTGSDVHVIFAEVLKPKKVTP